MPHFTQCPWCMALIVDWFHEWYGRPQYDQIKLGQLARDCPHHQCRKPVTLNKGKIVAAQNIVTAQRSVQQAEVWAVKEQGYPTLEAFLVHPDETPSQVLSLGLLGAYQRLTTGESGEQLCHTNAR